MGFNCNTIRAFDIKLIFSDSVGLGRESRIYEIKAPWVYAYSFLCKLKSLLHFPVLESKIKDNKAF